MNKWPWTTLCIAIVVLLTVYLAKQNDECAIESQSELEREPSLFIHQEDGDRSQVEQTMASEFGIHLDDLPVETQQRVKNYQDFQQLQSLVQQLFHSEKHLAQEEINALKEQLTLALSEAEELGVLTPDEIVLLKLGLLKQSTHTDAEYASDAQQLINTYSDKYQQANKSAQARIVQDPLFLEYKQREREITASILKMNNYPDGLTQSEYLRQQLDLAYEQVYKGNFN